MNDKWKHVCVVAAKAFLCMALGAFLALAYVVCNARAEGARAIGRRRRARVMARRREANSVRAQAEAD